MYISAPQKNEYPEHYGKYIALVSGADLISALRQSESDFLKSLIEIPTEKLAYRYAAGKWSIMEIMGHVTDTERIFAYRALRFARNDKTELPGFDEEKYAPESNADNRSINSLLEEFKAVRLATLTLYGSMTEEMFDRSGTANGLQISVRSLGFIIAGHSTHHLQVIRERYLK